MTVTVEIPDSVAQAFAPVGDLSRALLEATMALEGYRQRRLTESEIRRMLGFETRMEVHGFLKERGVYPNYGMDDLEHDIRESDRMLAVLAEEAAGQQRARSLSPTPARSVI